MWVVAEEEDDQTKDKTWSWVKWRDHVEPKRDRRAKGRRGNRGMWKGTRETTVITKAECF